MTQGKIERYHWSWKNVVQLEKYYSPWALERALARFVEDYNHRRLHESLDDATPADVYHGPRPAILARWERITQRTLHQRRRENLNTPHPAAQRREVFLTQTPQWSTLTWRHTLVRFSWNRARRRAHVALQPNTTASKLISRP